MHEMFVFYIATVSNIALHALAGFGAVITVPLMLVTAH